AADDVLKPLFRLPEGLRCAPRGTASRRLADAKASPSPPLLAHRPRSATEDVAISRIDSLARHRSRGRLLFLDPPRAAAGEPGLAAAFGQSAHPGDIGLALGHRDDAARIQQIEDVARLQALVIGGERQRRLMIEQPGADLLRILELAKQDLRIARLEI